MTPAAVLADSVRRAEGPRARRAVLRQAAPDAAAVRGLLDEAKALRRSHGAESARLARAALAMARAGRSSELASQAERALGQACLLLGRPRDALRRLRAAARRADAQTRPLMAPEIATALAELGRTDEARAELAEARSRLVTPRLRRVAAVLDLTEANLLQRIDRPEDALPLLERARRTLRRRGEQAGVAAVDLNRANVLANLHRYEHAEALYARVTAFQRARGQEAAALQSEYNRAYLTFLRGRFHEALARLREIAAAFQTLGDERHVGLCDLDAAEIHLRLNLPAEAEAAALRAAAVFDRLGQAADGARARFFAAAAARGVGHADEARTALACAIREFRRLGCGAWEAVALHRLAEVEREAGSVDQAQSLAADAAGRLLALGFLERAGRAECLLAGLETERGDAPAAIARLDALSRRLGRLHAPWLRCEVHHRMAAALTAQGRVRAALRHALRAVRALERHRVAAPPDEYMAAFLRDKAQVYARAVRLLLLLGSPRAEARAFELAEASKGRALLDLVKGRVRGGRDRGAASLVRQADALAHQIDGFAGRLPGPEGNVRGAEPARTGDWLRSRERRLDACLDRLAVRDPAAAALRAPKPPRLEDVAAALPADTVLVEFFQGERNGLISFVVTPKGMRVVEHDVSGPEMRHALAQARFHLERPQAFADAYGCAAAARRAADGCLGELHRLFLEPIRGHLTTRRVVIVPHGELHGVPFAALGTDGWALVDDHEVVTSPSTAVLLHGLERRPAAASGCVVLGVPDGAAPLIGEEVRRIGRIHPGARSYVGPSATRAALERAGGRARILHLASHAAYRPEDPMASGLLLGDGWLTAQDVFDLRLDAEVVVLSGCATGRSAVTEGDELFGLVRAFLHAGAENLVTSLWQVEDASTLRFMDRLHRALAAGASPAGAMRAATLALRVEFPHPHDWAAFSLVGTGGPTSRSPE